MGGERDGLNASPYKFVGWVYSPAFSRAQWEATTVGEYTHPTECEFVLARPLNVKAPSTFSRLLFVFSASRRLGVQVSFDSAVSPKSKARMCWRVCAFTILLSLTIVILPIVARAQQPATRETTPSSASTQLVGRCSRSRIAKPKPLPRSERQPDTGSASPAEVDERLRNGADEPGDNLAPDVRKRLEQQHFRPGAKLRERSNDHSPRRRRDAASGSKHRTGEGERPGNDHIRAESGAEQYRFATEAAPRRRPRRQVADGREHRRAVHAEQYRAIARR